MKRWPIKLLGELCDVEGGNAAPQGEEHYSDGTMPFVRMKDLGRFHFTNNLNQIDDRLTELAVETNRMKVFDSGCILFPRSGSVALNHRAILGVRACIVSHIGVLDNLRPEVTAGYLYRYLTTFDMTALSKKTTGVDSIAFADVKRIPVPVPPLQEQERIVKLLDEADDLRQLRDQADRRTADIMPALFHEMFGDVNSNNRNWPVVRFSDIGDARLGKMLDAKQQTGQHKRPYLRNANVQWDRIQTEEIFKMDFQEADREEFRLRYGDLLICEGGEVGRAAIWRDELPECYFQKALHRVRLNAFKAIPEYGLFLLKAVATHNGFRDYIGSATIPHLTGVKLASLLIPVPPLPLQQRFADRVREIHELEAEQARSAARLDDLFQSLLAQAFP